MDKTTILNNLRLLSEAQVGAKLCKSTNEWYLSSGILTAIARTIKGESRQDILDIMEQLSSSLETIKQINDVQTTRDLSIAIGQTIPGFHNILSTYKDDEAFIEKFKLHMNQITSFKEATSHPRSVNVPLHKYQPTIGFSRIGSLLTTNPSIRVGVQTMNTLLKRSIDL